MLTKAIETAVVVVVLGSAFASLARDGSGPPTIDIQKTCQETVSALGTALGGEIDENIGVCLLEERDARDQIVKDWENYPAIAKDRCVQPKEYLPGYVEWQACLDMTRDSLQILKEKESSNTADTTAGKTSKRRVGRAASDCPIVKYRQQSADIEYVINCPGIAMPGMQGGLRRRQSKGSSRLGLR